MRKLFERLHRAIVDFVEQRDDLLLLAACGPEDAALVLKALRDQERTSPSDVFLLFADDFTTPASFVTAAVERLGEERRMACEGLAEEGRPPLPSLPASLSDPSRPAADRLHEALAYARSLLPPGGGHRLVWAMLPAQIADRRAYLELVASCAPAAGVRPWMRGLRLIFRVEPDFDPKAAPFVARNRFRVARLDFGPAALAAAMREEAADPAVPEGERMQSVLALASIDAAHGRAAQATAQYNQVLAFAQKTDNPLMQALVLNGLGDLAQRQGDVAKAQHWYECSIPPAAASEQPQVLAAVAENLAAVAYQRQQYADAEQYYDSLSQLKGILLEEDGKARALEWRGLSQEKQRAYDRAVASWEEAELLSRAFELTHRLRPLLEHLRRGYAQLRRNERLPALEAELRTLRAG
jgi:tetratricopeptide (TPR) repeat protein